MATSQFDAIERPSDPRLGVAETVAVTDERLRDGEIEEVASSWRRSADDHHVDPGSQSAPHVLTSAELRHSRDPAEPLVRVAQGELDRLHAIVRHAGYVVLLCDSNGIALEQRSSPDHEAQFRYWGTWAGAVWSESVEGTNGIGTCIAERRPITVHQSQHFRSRHGSLSCSGAPVFNAEGRLAAVLDVSAIDPGLSSRSHGLTLPLVIASARAVEERMFREAFARSWVLAIAAADGDGPASLLAIDRDHRIVGADHLARVEFGIRQTDIEGGLSLWSCFAPTGSLVSRRAGSPDAAVALRSSSNDQPRYALVSAPVMSSRSQISAGDAEFLLRPRNAALADVKRLISVEPTRGGLSAGALRRVCEYVEAHLEDAVGLDVLAAEANLSVFHFAREFRRSMGVAPHRYIFEQRVRRAQQLLATTELPIAAIATAAGFFDQGHLSRSFRQIVGVTPSAFRRSRQ